METGVGSSGFWHSSSGGGAKSAVGATGGVDSISQKVLTGGPGEQGGLGFRSFRVLLSYFEKKVIIKSEPGSFVASGLGCAQSRTFLAQEVSRVFF